tara:strand:- start:209 stop:493 length:285 start_codon:yes stop_codon:yes gene_type:complete
MYIIFVILFLLFGATQIFIGGMGIQYYFGGLGLGVAIFLFTFFRISFPFFSVGSYFGAVAVLKWHWILALLFAMPGLLFMVPAFIAMITESFRK